MAVLLSAQVILLLLQKKIFWNLWQVLARGAKRELGDEVPEAFSNVPDYKFDKIMEYTEMIDKVKGFGCTKQSCQDRQRIRRRLRRPDGCTGESDPKAFAVAVGYMAKATGEQTKDSAVKQRIQDIQMLVSWREIAHTYFGKSASWLYHKLNGIDGNGGVGGFTEEKDVLRSALCEVSNRIRAAADRI